VTNHPHVLALASGRRAAPAGGGRATAIDKRPVESFEVRDPGPKHGGLGSGVVGDEIGNPKHHGGALQAVYAYPREDHQFWEHQIGRSIPSGGFGENITTLGVDTTHALVGERWRIDDVVLRVEVPRIPCSTFAAHLGEPRWVRRFTEAGRTGAYLSVVTPGTVRTGAAIEVERPAHDIDLLLLFRAFTGDLAAARRVVDADVVHPEVREGLVETLDRRGG
jgi:MOSC domain-containing protein YiiM